MIFFSFQNNITIVLLFVLFGGYTLPIKKECVTLVLPSMCNKNHILFRYTIPLNISRCCYCTENWNASARKKKIFYNKQGHKVILYLWLSHLWWTKEKGLQSNINQKLSKICGMIMLHKQMALKQICTSLH